MLPRAAYVSEAVLAWEAEHLFAGVWTCVGWAGRLAEPGSLRAVQVGPVGVLLARGGDGELRAFANVCRHRGHELLGPASTRVSCTWYFPRSSAGRPGFDPAYAISFWDTTNRQDWAACESVQRGLASPHFRPGPLAPSEDAVHHFVSMLAHAYLGTGPGGPGGARAEPARAE